MGANYTPLIFFTLPRTRKSIALDSSSAVIEQRAICTSLFRRQGVCHLKAYYAKFGQCIKFASMLKPSQAAGMASSCLVFRPIQNLPDSEHKTEFRKIKSYLMCEEEERSLSRYFCVCDWGTTLPCPHLPARSRSLVWSLGPESDDPAAAAPVAPTPSNECPGKSSRC